MLISFFSFSPLHLPPQAYTANSFHFLLLPLIQAEYLQPCYSLLLQRPPHLHANFQTSRLVLSVIFETAMTLCVLMFLQLLQLLRQCQPQAVQRFKSFSHRVHVILHSSTFFAFPHLEVKNSQKAGLQNENKYYYVKKKNTGSIKTFFKKNLY